MDPSDPWKVVMGTAEGTIGQENQEGEWTSMCILSPSLPPNTTSLSPLTCASSMAGTGLKRTNGNWEAYRKGKIFFPPKPLPFLPLPSLQICCVPFWCGCKDSGRKGWGWAPNVLQTAGLCYSTTGPGQMAIQQAWFIYISDCKPHIILQPVSLIIYLKVGMNLVVVENS